MKNRSQKLLKNYKKLIVMLVFILNFAYLFTYQTSDAGGDIIKNIWDLFPKIEKKEPLKLRNYSIDQNLIKTEIKEENGVKKIIWDYTTDIHGIEEFLDDRDRLNHFFSTTKTSGLGTPKIKYIVKPDGQILNTPNSTTTSYTRGELNTTDVNFNLSSFYFHEGTYKFVIETPITEVRDNYTLYVNSELTAKMSKNEQVPPGGTLSEDTVIKAPSIVYSTVKADDNWGDYNNLSLVDLKKDGPNSKEIDEDNLIAQGSYTSNDTIKWTATYINDNPNVKESARFNFSPDNSQRPKGKVKLYFYKPGEGGYVQTDEQETEPGEISIDNINPGTIVQAVLETDIIDKNSKHSLGEAELESMYANLTIKKVWIGTPADDAKFTLWTDNQSHDVTIPKENTTQNSNGNQTTIYEGIDKVKFKKTNGNPSYYSRINYRVEEKDSENYELSWSTVDKSKLIYTFANRQRRKFDIKPPKIIDDDDDADGQCGSQVYGVFEINPVQIHSYKYKGESGSSWFGFGGGIEGKFRIPANTGSGAYFTLKIPQELKIEKGVSTDVRWANIFDDKGTPIGEMYLTKRDELTFKLNSSAKKSSDYEGFFYIGYQHIKTGVCMADGKNITEQEANAKNYLWGVVQDPATFYDRQDPRNRNVTKKVNYLSTFYDGKGGSECEAVVESTANINYNDEDIMHDMRDANKYVVEDNADENYLIYEIVVNCDKKKGITQFTDYLSETIELYHGNDQSAIEKDVEVYVGEPTGSCSVDKNTIKQIYPRREISYPNITIKGRRLNNYTDSASKTKRGMPVIEKYKLNFTSNGFNGKSFLVRMKVRRISEFQIPDGRNINYTDNGQLYAYNRVQVDFRSGNRTSYQNTYATTLAGGGASAVGDADKGQFRIRKIFTVGNTSVPIKNNPATFKLSTDPNGENVIQTTKTDKDGYADFINLEKGKTYYLRETHSPNGYKKSYTNYKVTVSPNDINDIKIQKLPDGAQVPVGLDKPFDIKNERMLPIRIKKIDKNSKKSLAGAVFRLTNKDNNTPEYDVVLGKGQSISEFVFDGLCYGTYILEEVKAPKGYQKINPIEIEYNEDTDQLIKLSDLYDLVSGKPKRENGAYTMSITNDNGKKKSDKLQFQKTNQYGKNFREDLYETYSQMIDKGQIKLNDGFGNVTKEQKLSQLLSEFSKATDFFIYKKLEYSYENFDPITFSDGTKIVPYLKNGTDDVFARMDEKTSIFEFDKLPQGKYWIVEKIRPNFFSSYDIFKKVYDTSDFTRWSSGIGKALLSFEVDNKGLVSKVNDQTNNDLIIKAKNTKKSTSFNIKKVDYKDKTPLEGAEFTLYRVEGKHKSLVTRQESDQNGFIHFQDLAPGTYSLVESKAPDNYRIKRKPYDVTINENLQVTIKRAGKVVNKTFGLYQIDNKKDTKIRIIKKNEKNQKLKGTSKFCMFKVGDNVEPSDLDEAIAHNDGYGKYKGGNCTWHEYTSDQGDDLIRLKGKDYYLPKKRNTGINYQLFEVKDGMLAEESLKFRTPGKYVFAEYESPAGYSVIKKPLLVEISKDKDDFVKLKQLGTNNNIYLSPDNNIMSFTVKNDLVKAKFGLKKVKETDNKTKNPIGEDLNLDSEVEFKLTKMKGRVEPNVEVGENDIDKSFGTNGSITRTFKLKDKAVFDNLSAGYYDLQETKVPDGYMKTKEINRILVDKKGDLSLYVYKDGTAIRSYDIKEYEMHVDNWLFDNNNLVRIGNRQEPKGKFAFYKKAESTTNLMAELYDRNLEAKFKLTKDGDSSFSALEQTKKASEKFIFENLKKGIYTLEETQAPRGYLKTAKNYKISVDELGDVRIFEPTDDEVPKKVRATFSHNLKTNSISNISSATDGNEGNEAVFNLKNSKIEKGDYIQLDLGIIHYISKVKLLQNINANKGNNDAFDDVDLEYSLDETTFHKLKNYANTNPNKGTFANSIRTIDENTPFCAKVVRIRNKIESGGRWLRLNEFMVEGYPVSLKQEISLENQKHLASKDDHIFEIGNLEIPKIKLIKTDEKGRDIAKANAEFELRKVDDASVNVDKLTEDSGELVYQILVKEGTSKLIDSKGKEISDNQLSLDTLGKYILVEKTSPKSYKKLDKPILLEAYQDQVAINGSKIDKKKILWFRNLDNDGNVEIKLEENGRLMSFKAKNKKIKAKFAFKKKIQSDPNKPMQDIPNGNLQAEFKLTKDGLLSGFNPLTKKQKVSTAFEFANLEAGDYSLEESLAPAGFMKTNDKYKVKIDDYGNVVVYKELASKNSTKINATLSHSFGSIQIDYLANASDGNDKTQATFHLSPDTIRKNDYVQLEFDGSYYITSLKFVQNTARQNTGRDIFDDFDIEYSLDGRNFYKAASYNNTFVNDKAIKTINLSNPFVAKYVRIRSNVESTRRWLRVDTFEAQGYRVEPVKDMQNENQENIAETDVFAIGNFENPKIKIIKQDDGGRDIANANAEFELRKVDDTNNDVNKLDDNSGELVHKISIENGQTKLKKADGTEIEGNQLQIEKLGKYILVEKVPPRGYRKLDKPILLNVKEDQVDGGNKKISWFEIKSSNNKSSNNIASLNLDTSKGLEAIFKVKNKEIKSKFAFKKKAESLSAPMANIGGAKTATFKLTKDGDSSFSKTSTKNVSENFEFTDLKKGDYTLEETQAPKGFVKTDKLYKIRIDDEGTVRVYEDSKNPGDERVKDVQLNHNLACQVINIENVTDGKENTQAIFYLNNDSLKEEDYISLDLKTTHKISKIKLITNKANTDKAGNDAFDDCALEYSFDGKTYFKLRDYQNTNPDKKNRANTINTITYTEPLYARYIRVRNKLLSSGRWLRVDEFAVEGHKVKDIGSMSQKDQEKLKPFDIGNLQNPRLVLEKIDAKTNELIDTNKVNKDFTAKFALYKIPDNAKSFDARPSNDKKKLKDFTLVNGMAELADDSITELGRYALCESESPDDYQTTKPIILDLVKVKGATGTKLSLGWKLVSESLSEGVYNLQAQDANKKFDDKIEIDYSKLFDNDPAITLKVKNYRDDRGKFEFDKVDKANNNPLNGASFKLTKDNDNNFPPITRDGTNTSRFVFENLSPGTYTLEETVVPTGYKKEDKTLKAFVNDYGDTSLFSLSGEEKVGKIPLTKDNLIYSDRYGNYIADVDKARMFDNDKNSFGDVKLWSQSVGDYVEKDEFVGIDLKGLYRIASFDFNQGPVQGSNTGNDAYDEFVIEYSLDGVNYRRFKKYKNPNGTNKPSDDNRNEVYDISENLNTYARYIRIRNLSRGERRWLKIRDISATGYKVEEIKNFRKNAIIDSAKIENIKIKKVKLKIAKLDLDGNSIRGDIYTSARFFISKTDSQDENNKYNGQVADLKDGAFTFDNGGQLFEPGLYYLVESRAPKGYMKLSKPIPFFIENDGRLIIPAKLKDGSTREYVKDENFIYKDYIKVKENNSDENLLTIEVKNQKFTYPRTGGRGIIFLSIIGVLVMSLGIFLYQRKTSIER